MFSSKKQIKKDIKNNEGCWEKRKKRKQIKIPSKTILKSICYFLIKLHKVQNTNKGKNAHVKNDFNRFDCFCNILL